MFRNPPGDYAGRLIEAAGLKGKRIGQAQISERHANFIVNLGGAKADDVRRLMELARSEVQQTIRRRADRRSEALGRLVGELKPSRSWCTVQLKVYRKDNRKEGRTALAPPLALVRRRFVVAGDPRLRGFIA